MIQMEYFKECLQDFNKPNDWQDISYGNDACPSFEYNGYHIYVDHPVPSERDSGADLRYCVSISFEYGEMGWTLETDDFSEVLEALKVPYLERPLLHSIHLYLEEEERRGVHEYYDADDLCRNGKPIFECNCC